MPKFKDLTGQRFGRLIVLHRATDFVSKHGKRQVAWICECDCGAQCRVRAKNLTTGNNISCGNHRGTHQHSRSQDPLKRHLYHCWSSAKTRCLTQPDYQAFGMYEPWKIDFQAFADAIGAPPSQKHSVDRIDGTKGYFPGNVRWATPLEQSHNRRDNWKIATGNQLEMVTEISRTTGIKYGTIVWRMKHSWPTELLLKSPDKTFRHEKRTSH